MDIRLLYPVPRDFIEHTERGDPELYNYCCFHGKQCFLRRYRGKYAVMTGNWCPKGHTLEESAFATAMGYHLVYSSSVLENCVAIFKKICIELFSVEYDLFDFNTLEVHDELR
ncbi:hypothetical protein [Tortoise microvirus 60]|nr:hypothetical protein [Tortoise microvirus 60]